MTAFTFTYWRFGFGTYLSFGNLLHLIFQGTALEMTIHHLLRCTNKLLRAPSCEISDLTSNG